MRSEATFLIGAAVLLAAAAAAARDSKPVGTETRGWIALQKSPMTTAKGPVRGLPGEAAERVYQRYLQSFTHPIPERYDRDRFASEGQSR